MAVALNIARSGRRREGTAARARRLIAVASADLPDLAELVDLDRAVARLPKRQREAVVLYYLLDLDVSTVAQLLDVSDGTIKTALSRARAKLAEALAGRG